MSNFVNTTPYIRSTREFPENIKDLAFQSNKAYLEVANAINQRTIGIFPVIKSAITGEQWFINKNRKQQSLRQVYTFGTIAAGATLLIPYTLPGFDLFVRIWGTCVTVIPDSRPLPYSSVTANANIELRVDTVNHNIVIIVGAASPNITSGIIIIEWLSQAWYSLDI
jgi:hypothetical protein